MNIIIVVRKDFIPFACLVRSNHFFMIAIPSAIFAHYDAVLIKRALAKFLFNHVAGKMQNNVLRI